MTGRFSVAFILIAASMMTLAQNAVPVVPPKTPQEVLSLQLAYQAANTALEACKTNGFPKSSVAVTDTSGLILVMLRSPGAPEPTMESARRKAYTVSKTGMSTADFAKSKGWVDTVRPPAANAAPSADAAARDPFVGLPVFDNDRSLVPWGGGLPILSGGKVVGGIGLSGAAGGQKDEDCVKVGADAVKDKAK